MPGGSSGGQVYPGAQQNSGGTTTPWQSPWSGALLSSFFNGFGSPSAPTAAQPTAPAPAPAQSNVAQAPPGVTAPPMQAAQAPNAVTAGATQQPVTQPVSTMQPVMGAAQAPPGVTAAPVAQPAPMMPQPTASLTAFAPQNGITAPAPQQAVPSNAFGMLGAMFPQNASQGQSLGGGF